MKKIDQGQHEIFTTKSDAINKFMQMQGVCRGELNGEKQIEFYCHKNGEIAITNPPRRHTQNINSTNLFAKMIEQDGKTYLTYYTTYSQCHNILKVTSLSC